MTPEQCQKLMIDQLEQLTEKKLLLAEAESLSTHAILRVTNMTDPPVIKVRRIHEHRLTIRRFFNRLLGRHTVV